MMAISDPEERASVAGIVGMSKTVPSAVSPPIAGYFIQNLTLALPFFAGGILQMTADILFYAFFRKHKPPEELNRSKILKKGDHR
jgi:zinc transporter ZupT